VNNTNNSAKNIPVKPHNKLKKHALNSSKLFHNGDCLDVKRSKTEKNNSKRAIFNRVVMTQDEN